MDKPLKIAFLGGDQRQRIAAVKLGGGRYDISALGLDDEALKDDGKEEYDRLSQTLDGAKAVILPLPVSTDGVFLNTKKELGEKIVLSNIADRISDGTVVIGGKLPNDFKRALDKRKIKFFDYFESEVFQIKNAYTTAEAALSIAMDKLQKTLRTSNFAITGYGRIAKQLAELLIKLGGRVTVCARKDSDLAWAELAGCSRLKINSEDKATIEPLLYGYDIIFNTVPQIIFDENLLKQIDKSTLLIELASSPGGIDVLAAKRLHSNVLWAASLPGKYAPVSAGELIADCVLEILEREVGV